MILFWYLPLIYLCAVLNEKDEKGAALEKGDSQWGDKERLLHS